VDVIDRMTELIIENGIEKEKADEIASTIRFEYGGELVYFPKRSETVRETILKELSAGASENDIIRKFRVSRKTVYRMIRKIKRGMK
jgi:Mor family transcriptional regulator